MNANNTRHIYSRLFAFIRGPILFGVLLHAAPAAGVTSYFREGNYIRFRLSGQPADIEWITDSTFRYSLGDFQHRDSRDAVPVSVTDLGGAVQLRTRYLLVDLQKRDFRLRVRAAASGDVLMEETAGPESTEDGIALVRRIAADEQFYGLGPRSDASLSARGMSILSSRPFLISTAGYGLFYPGSSRVLFDLGKTAAGRARIISPGDRVDYYFYYGPTPKEIFEQHFQVAPPVSGYRPSDFEHVGRDQLPSYATPLPKRLATFDGLLGTARAMIHASMSGLPAPALDLAAWRGSEAERAAGQLAAVAPIVIAPGPIPPLRQSLYHVFIAYIQEARDRGFPMIHPLPMQFPSDLEGAKWSDEFMLGDELLVAPIHNASGKRRVYLPMGVWTELRNNRRHRGRQVIDIDSPDALPLFAKNGCIVPLAAGKDGGPVSLHYFPSLGAEYFLYEAHSGETTQFHASPAAGYYRLEIETKETRLYEWVLHHAGAAEQVNEGESGYQRVSHPEELKPGYWYYDSAVGNLHVRLEARAGEDRIVNIK